MATRDNNEFRDYVLHLEARQNAGEELTPEEEEILDQDIICGII